MAFQVEDIADLLRLIHEHPEWRDQLRAAILPGEVLNLPQSIAELVEAQKQFQQTLERHDQRLGRLEQTVAELVEAQKRFQQTLEAHDRRLERLEQTVAELVEAQKRFQQTLEQHNERLARLEQISIEHNERISRLEQIIAEHNERLTRLEQIVAEHSERITRLERAVAELTEAVRNLVRVVERLETRLGKVSGFYYEFHFRERAPSYFGRILRRTRGLLPQDIDRLVEDHLSREEMVEFYNTDVIVRGIWEEDGEPLYFATEVSETVDANDVARALRRADLLRKAGLRALPAVAGSSATQEAQLLAGREKVLLISDGASENLETALQRLSAEG